jgi:hypothetical protein
VPDCYPGGYEKFVDEWFLLYWRLTKLFGKNAAAVVQAMNEMRASMLTRVMEEDSK